MIPAQNNRHFDDNGEAEAEAEAEWRIYVSVN